jgi:hypothetical protein
VRSELTREIKQFGLGILNLTIAIALLIAVRAIAHGHVSDFGSRLSERPSWPRSTSADPERELLLGANHVPFHTEACEIWFGKANSRRT